jgi:hypothetical protein
MSSATSVNEALAGYAAGRMTAQQLVRVVAAAHYGDGGRRTGDGLAAVIDIIERAHPGVVELASTTDRPGFAVRLAERPFPKKFEAELREVVTKVLNRESPRPGLFARILRAFRRAFSA